MFDHSWQFGFLATLGSHLLSRKTVNLGTFFLCGCLNQMLCRVLGFRFLTFFQFFSFFIFVFFRFFC